MTELVVGTKKGLFLLDGAHGSGFGIKARAFAGQPVDFATREPGSGRFFATVTSPFYGPKIFYTDGDLESEWEQADGVALPEGGDQALERIWVIACGEAVGTMYAGGDPGVLLRAMTVGAAGRSMRGSGNSRRARGGNRVVAGCACTRSAPGREIRTSWPWLSRPPEYG